MYYWPQAGIATGKGHPTTTKLIFVHGTGVRQAAFDASFVRFSANLLSGDKDLEPVPCCWGASLGVPVGAGRETIPAASSSRGITEGQEWQTRGPESHDSDLMLWTLLERDPLVELDAWAAQSRATRDLPPGAGSSAWGDTIKSAADDALVSNLVNEHGLADAFVRSVDFVASDRDARQVAKASTAQGFAVLARAIVAKTLQIADEEAGQPIPLTAQQRDAITEAVVAALGGSERGLRTSVLGAGLRTASRVVMPTVDRHRHGLTDQATNFSGDILSYLARGERIRQFISAVIRQCDGRKVIIAHSLGGVACVDLLVSTHFADLDLLVTVGSQAPYLYAVDALPSLEMGEPLPMDFPRWVNIYDPRDLLAFIGENVFPGRVEDRLLESGVPFPRAHSAYFANEDFYQLLASLVK